MVHINMNTHVFVEGISSGERFIAPVTFVRFYTRVGSYMADKVKFCLKLNQLLKWVERDN
jgi:hypothetical protein